MSDDDYGEKLRAHQTEFDGSPLPPEPDEQGDRRPPTADRPSQTRPTAETNFDGAWLDQQNFPPIEFAVPGLVPEGLGLLVAPPKIGKSWLACALGIAVASGGRALGQIRVNKRPCLYLALEDGARRLQSRCRQLCAGDPIPPALHFITKVEPSQLIPTINEFLNAHAGEKPLIILDTLGKARPPRPPGADLYSWDYAIGGQLKAVIDAVPGASLLLIHHTRKGEAADFIDTVSGSQGVAGSADYVIVLSRKRHSDEGVLAVTGRDIPEAEYAVKTSAGRWELDGSDLNRAAQKVGERRQQQTLGDRALEVLAFVNTREQTKPADVAERFDLTPNRAGEVLARLADTGRIAKLRRGIYISAPRAESAESAENAGQNVVSFPHTKTGGAESAENKPGEPEGDAE